MAGSYSELRKELRQPQRDAELPNEPLRQNLFPVCAAKRCFTSNESRERFYSHSTYLFYLWADMETTPDADASGFPTTPRCELPHDEPLPSLSYATSSN